MFGFLPAKISFSHTSLVISAAIDFGGAWIHGNSTNNVYDYAIEQKKNLYYFDYESKRYLSSTIPDLSNASENMSMIGKSFMTYLRQRRNAYSNGQDSPISDTYADFLNTDTFSNDQKCYLANYVSFELENEYGTKIENLSTANYDDVKASTDYNFLLPDGYWNLFDPLINFDYQLNSKVVSIDQSTESKVQVTLDNKKVLSADYVIVTVPLGVLKKDVISFTPQLSQNKQNAIKKLNFGSLEKVVVEFSNAFWSESDTNLINILNDPISPLGYIVNYYKIGKKNTLIFLVAGEGKYWNDYYSATEEMVKSKVISTLSTYYPDKTISITKIYWTTWKNDPFSYGAYSSYAPNSNSDLVKEFSNKEGRVFFAGEHTSKDYLQTVQGAYESGKRVAQQIQLISASFIKLNFIMVLLVIFAL